MLKVKTFLYFIVVFSVLLICLEKPVYSGPRNLQVGGKMPEFSLQSTKGNLFSYNYDNKV